MPRFTSRAAGLALSAQGTRGPDDEPDCACGCGLTADWKRQDGLSFECGQEADAAAHEAAEADAELVADLANDEGFLATCSAEVLAWIETVNIAGPEAGARYARAV